MGSPFGALVVLVVLFATGAPVAYCLTRGRSEWVRFTFESLVVGLLAQVAIGVVALRSGHYSLGLLAGMTLALMAAGAIVAGRRGIRERPALDLPLLLIVLGLVAGALLLRRYPSYFAFRVGDMGGYVNGANQIAAGRSGGNFFPPGFTVFLAGTNALLGKARTVSGLPALGVVLLLATISLGKLIGLRTAAVAVVGLIVVIHPITIWFSLFPVSEVLYSVLLISALYFMVRARAECSYAYGAVSGLVIGLMLLVRINAMLLAPMLIVLLLASAAADRDAVYQVQRSLTIVALAALSCAYAYDIHYVRPYILRQLRGKLIPRFAFRAAKRWDLFDVSIVLIVAVASMFALVLLAAHFVRAYAAPRVRQPAGRLWQRSAASVVGIAVVGLALSPRAGVDDGLARWGPALLVLAAGGIAVLALRPGRYFDGAAGFFVVLVVATYTLLFALRLPHPRRAIYYLYWDRYLYSEVLPFALVLVAIALHGLIGVSVDADHRRTALRVVAVVALISMVGFAVVPSAVHTRDSGITRQALYGDVYGKLSSLDRLARIEGDRPIVYSGARPVPRGWFFPSTNSAFARPLEESFGRIIVGTKAFGPAYPDPVFDPTSARAALAEAGYDAGYLMTLRRPFATRFPDDAHTRYLGAVLYTVPILRRSLDRWSERFNSVRLRFEVYALT
jgi:hypothetical protein